MAWPAASGVVGPCPADAVVAAGPGHRPPVMFSSTREITCLAGTGELVGHLSVAVLQILDPRVFLRPVPL